MNRKSIYGRLVLFLVLGLGTLLTLFGLGLDFYLTGKFQERFDAEILGRAQLLITLTKIYDGQIELDFADEFMPEFSEPEGPEYFQIWFNDGSILERSDSLETRDLPREPAHGADPVYKNIELEPGGRCRMVQISFIPQDQTGDKEGELEIEGREHEAMTLCIAKNREDFDQFLDRIQVAMLVAFLVLLAISVFLVKQGLDYGLKPLDDIRRQVARLDPHNLGTPILLRDETQELMPVVNQLNSMLARLDSAMERERQFTSNVAHELRTPIAELRSIAQVGVKLLDHPEGDHSEATRRFLKDVREIATEMEQMVVNLLSLSRYDSGTLIISESKFDLARVIRKSWRRASASARANGMRSRLNLAKSLWVRSDELMLEQIIQNLINNAVAHGSPASPIEVTATQTDRELTIAVRNACTNLDHEDLEHLSERFWRKDTARTESKHAGLGLSLVYSFANLLGMTVKAELDDDTFFTVTISGECRVH